MNAKDLRDAIDNADKILRPTVVFMHPETFEEIKQHDPDIEKKLVIYTHDCIDKNTCYAMSREDFDFNTKLFMPDFKPFEF